MGDDTHGHVDDIARFVAPDVVVLAYEEDPADENHRRSMRQPPAAPGRGTGADGRPLRVVTLPYPRPVMMDGERLPASYANFYIANGVVIVPTFNDRNDRVALNTLAELLPRPRRSSASTPWTSSGASARCTASRSSNLRATPERRWNPRARRESHASSS